MTTRYSGALTITVTWNDRLSGYDARVSWVDNPGTQWAKRRSVHLNVGRPPVADRRGGPVDAPESYDEAAKAAIAFADHDHTEDNIGEMAEMDPGGRGYVVRRSPRGEARDAADCDHTHPPTVPSGPCPPGGDPSAYGAPVRETAQVIFDAERRKRVLAPIDEDALTELDLYIENTGDLYPMKQAIRENLKKKLRKGVYDAKKAIVAWGHWVEAGARAYAKDYAEPAKWSVLFPKPLRDKLSERIAEREYYEIAREVIPPSKHAVARDAGEAAATPFKKEGCLPEVRLEKSPSFEACMKEKRKLGPIDGPKKVHALCAPRIGTADQEHFLVVLLDVRQHLKGIYTAAKGQQSHVAVGIQDIMKVVIDSRAAAFTVVHNHPTGNPKPSDQDRKLTTEIAKATKPYGRDMTFVDHVVIGTGTRYYSLREMEPKLFDV
jgi:hypothetical protein